jgi:hypothetical protein
MCVKAHIYQLTIRFVSINGDAVGSYPTEGGSIPSRSMRWFSREVDIENIWPDIAWSRPYRGINDDLDLSLRAVSSIGRARGF